MGTVNDICTQALRELGAVALEEPPTNAEAQQAFIKLNDMLESWNVNRLTVFQIVQNVFPWVAGQKTYTCGTGGNFNMTRPIKIVEAYNRDAQGNDYKIDCYTDYDTYSRIITKNTGSTLVTALYDDGGWPLKTLYAWPVPTSGSYSAVLWTWNAIAAFTNLAQVVSLPPAYVRALKYNLAIECGPSFGAAISPDLHSLASSSKREIERINTAMVLNLGFDPTLTRRGRVFNWLTGS